MWAWNGWTICSSKLMSNTKKCLSACLSIFQWVCEQPTLDVSSCSMLNISIFDCAKWSFDCSNKIRTSLLYSREKNRGHHVIPRLSRASLIPLTWLSIKCSHMFIIKSHKSMKKKNRTEISHEIKVCTHQFYPGSQSLQYSVSLFCLFLVREHKHK